MYCQADQTVQGREPWRLAPGCSFKYVQTQSTQLRFEKSSDSVTRMTVTLESLKCDAATPRLESGLVQISIKVPQPVSLAAAGLLTVVAGQAHMSAIVFTHSSTTYCTCSSEYNSESVSPSMESPHAWQMPSQIDGTAAVFLLFGKDD